MRSINLGIIVQQETTITIELPVSDPDAMVRIARGVEPSISDLQFIQLASSDQQNFAIPLTRGDYVLTVDCTRPPGTNVSVTTDVDVTFWSAGDLDSAAAARSEVAPPSPEVAAHSAEVAAPSPWMLWVGRGAITSENPKKPWPGATASSTGVVDPSPISTSPIADAMQQLLDAAPAKGADTGAHKSAIYALLIGIDQYNDGAGQDGAIYRDLQGCVHDVLEVEKLLRLQLPDIKITRLIAPRPGGPGRDLAALPNSVPTYANIVAAWRTLMQTAQRNDIVYIHYSGHGGRATTRFPSYKPNGIDESLAPCDINDRAHGRYLRDVEIATLLQQMAQRELLTTLVLDSCHSGEATRGPDAQARTSELGNAVDQAPRGSDTLESDVAPLEQLNAVAGQLASSPTGPDATWRIDATLGQATSFNTVIAACRGEEAAYEYAPEGNTRCGALTYFWLKALAERGAGATYRRLYDQVFANVHNVFANQAPMLLGEGDRLVFGSGIMETRPSVPVRQVNNDEIRLGAGAAMQIEVGMHLAIVPPDRVPELVDLAAMPEVEVTAIVDEVTSLARLVARRDPSTDVPAPIKVGAQGIIRSYPLRMQRTVRLNAAPGASDVLARVADAIARDPSKLIAVAAEGPADYQVFVNPGSGSEPGSLQIADAAGVALRYVPPIAISADRDAGKLAEQLVHIARYSNVAQLANSDPGRALSGKLEVKVLDLPGYAPGGALTPVPLPPGLPRIQYGSYFCLRVRNQSMQELQLSIIDLQADWAIDTLTSEPAQLPPGATRDFAIKASFTAATLADPTILSEKDVLKVLATKRAAQARLLQLPPLIKASSREALRGPVREPQQTLSSLDNLFELLQEPSEVMRKAELASTPSDGWTVVQTEIEIYRLSVPNGR